MLLEVGGRAFVPIREQAGFKDPCRTGVPDVNSTGSVVGESAWGKMRLFYVGV